jgi:hypothetical protein
VPDTRPADADRTWPPCPAVGASDNSLTERRRPYSATPTNSSTEERTNARSIDRGVSRPELSKALVHFIADHGSAARILAEHTERRTLPTLPGWGVLVGPSQVALHPVPGRASRRRARGIAASRLMDGWEEIRWIAHLEP